MKKIPKIWRELPKEQKLRIPTEYFKINKKIIQKIRNINNPKKRLIEATRIQYNLFGEIHSYLTSWIAGYLSDAVIRRYFGSTKNLREYFIKSPKINKELKPSWQDIKRNIKIPKKMTKELAEEIGIHIGDGNLYITTNKDNSHSQSYSYTISGDLTDETEYHTIHIASLMKKIYNIKGNFIKRVSKNNIDSRYKSKAIINFKNKILKLPIGPKKDIKIPKEVLENDKFSKKCIVGIIDTDFSITKFLAISGKINNLFAAKEMHKILIKNNIPHTFKIYSNNYARFYIPKKGAIEIIEEWGLNNPKHLSKYHIFKKYKKVIPFTTTPERISLLNKEIDIQKLEKLSNKRKLKYKTRNA